MQLPKTAKHDDPEILHRANARRDFDPAKVVPDDSLFVLGDSRDFSFDSRQWGFLPERNVRGRVVYVIWSLNPEVSWTEIRHKIRKERFFRQVE